MRRLPQTNIPGCVGLHSTEIIYRQAISKKEAPARRRNGPEENLSDMIPLSAVPRRPLGRTGLQVSVLGFGTAPLGDLFAKLDDATAIAAAERAFELGINLVDTSPHYGRGLSEHRCGTAIRRLPRQDIVVCTKVGRWMDPFHLPNDR